MKSAVLTLRAVKALPFELLLYLAVSVVALSVDVGILSAMTRLGGFAYQLSGVVAFMAGAAVSYSLSVKFVFQHRRIRHWPMELLAFVAIGVAGLLLNMLVLRVAVGGYGSSVELAKMVSAGLVFTFNFAVRKGLLFSKEVQ